MTWELSDIPKKRKLPCHLQSEKSRKCISPVSSVKCLGKKKSHDMGPLQLFGLQKDAKHVMSTNPHTVHVTSHMTCVFSPGSPMSCVNLITYSHAICQKNGKYLPVRSAQNSHVMCKKNHSKIDINPMSCAKNPRLNRPQSPVSFAPAIHN